MTDAIRAEERTHNKLLVGWLLISQLAAWDGNGRARLQVRHFNLRRPSDRRGRSCQLASLTPRPCDPKAVKLLSCKPDTVATTDSPGHRGAYQTAHALTRARSAHLGRGV